MRVLRRDHVCLARRAFRQGHSDAMGEQKDLLCATPGEANTTNVCLHDEKGDYRRLARQNKKLLSTSCTAAQSVTFDPTSICCDLVKYHCIDTDHVQRSGRKASSSSG